MGHTVRTFVNYHGRAVSTARRLLIREMKKPGALTTRGLPRSSWLPLLLSLPPSLWLCFSTPPSRRVQPKSTFSFYAHMWALLAHIMIPTCCEQVCNLSGTSSWATKCLQNLRSSTFARTRGDNASSGAPRRPQCNDAPVTFRRALGIKPAPPTAGGELQHIHMYTWS